MATYGYVRVSSRDQNVNRQLDALGAFPVSPENIFVDHMSGKDFERPSYQRLVGLLAPGDLVVVSSIDRLGRDYEEIIAQWRRITHDLGADIVVLDMPLLDTRAPAAAGGVTGRFISDLVLQVLSYVAQVERENIRRRQAEGIAAARARGTRFGRPRKERPDHYREVLCSYELGELSKTKAASLLSVSRSTFDRWREQEDPSQPRASGM